jgi:hypothetical protein
MTLQDFVTLIKKIGVAILVALIPFLIFFIGLRIVQHIL